LLYDFYTFKHDLQHEIVALKETLRNQEKKENERIEEKMHELLSNIFSPGQIQMLLQPSLKKIKWSSEDIARAISLRCVSPKAYRYMRDVLKIPLPGCSTLRRWASTIDMNPGVLTSVLCMKAKGKSIPDIHRLLILTFDEMYLSNKVAIDRKIEKVIGPHRTCQCVMVRSLFSSWKQPVYYKFDKSMDACTLLDIISQLYHAGYIVVAITSDMGSSNMNLWSQLNIGIPPKTCYFQHPVCVSLKIFVFADAPHLSKLLRNHFIDEGFFGREK